MREAPVINKIDRMLKNNKSLKNKIKMIGIGAKDDSFNMAYFKETFKVTYPLFPDEDRVIHKQLGEPNTPFFVCVKIKTNGEIEVFNTHLGQISQADEFITMLIDLGGLK